MKHLPAVLGAAFCTIYRGFELRSPQGPALLSRFENYAHCRLNHLAGALIGDRRPETRCALVSGALVESMNRGPCVSGRMPIIY